ncbi:ABC transporter substrate-binding protein (plasmid) [Bartonella sp. HY329]|uniref:ABC transporter substrate-binding protein n=1 Tax=unclassified Bartonella TaxID=2645622 RepID=UPI0021C89418|nr:MULTISPECIES: ABC transporter substrate-binding protein [unclassified Bartonella]UXM96459.1 ABC transporter substrate-binding protein [Bartonella sp. HY329]UXN10782.1 ABC transporter substrate-binding protein [Bartonella sp. HY328]
MDRRTFLIQALPFISMMGGFGAQAQANSKAIILSDAMGRRVKIERPPQRIIPIFASNVELVAALGLAERIVGVEAYTRFPPEMLKKPIIGGRLGFSVDAIVALQPDLIILTPARGAVHQLIEPMTRLNIPVIVLLARDINEIFDNLRLIARASYLGNYGEEVVANLEKRLSVIANIRPPQPPRIVMITGLVGNGLVLIARTDSYTGDAIIKAGGSHAINQTIISQISPEAIIAANPDIILYAGERDGLDKLIAHPAWQLAKAVRKGNCYNVSRAEFLILGPRIIDGIEKLATVLERYDR